MPFITIHTNFDTRRYGFLPPSRWPEAHPFLLNLNKKEAGWVSEKREHKRHSEMTRSSPAPAMVTRQPNLAIQLFKMFHGFQLVQLFPFHSYGEASPPIALWDKTHQRVIQSTGFCCCSIICDGKWLRCILWLWPCNTRTINQSRMNSITVSLCFFGQARGLIWYNGSPPSLPPQGFSYTCIKHRRT